jgi:DNA-binding response OmpR family regulator
MSRKVLLVDDSIAIKKAVEATLESRDFEVVSVAEGNEAIQEAKKTRPDLILLDSVLKDGDGYEFCRRIKADPELEGIPVILLTAEGDEADASRVLGVGADGHLTKPFQEKDLMDRALSLVGEADEGTVKLDTTEMEVLDMGEGDEPAGEDLDLDDLDLDLEDEELLELTDEVEEDELRTDIEAPEELARDEEEIELKPPVDQADVTADIESDEMDEISFEEELKDIDLTDLELEAEEAGLSLGVDEEDKAATAAADDLEDEDTIDLGLEPEEVFAEESAEGELTHTGVEIIGETDEKLKDTHEEAPPAEEVPIPEDAVSAEEGVSMDETSIDWGAIQEAGGEEITLERAGADERIIDTGIEEETELQPEAISAFDDLQEPAEAEEIQALEVSEEALEVPEEAVEVREEAVEYHEEAVEVPEAAVEVPEEEIIQEIAPTLEIDLGELHTDEIPSLEAGLRMELMEEDFAAGDAFFEERVRREISIKLQEMVEGLISDLAEPIVERVAREVALERTEKIVMEEIDRLKSEPEGA